MNSLQNWKEINWLNSYPKSGNTWVRCFIEAYIKGELNINDLEIVITDDQLRFLGIDSEDEDFKDLINLPSFIQLLSRPYILYRIVQYYKKSGIKIPLFIKSHTANITVDDVSQIISRLTKRILYIVRNPIDIAPSFADHLNIELDDVVDRMCNDAIGLESRSKGKIDTPMLSWKLNVTSYLKLKENEFFKIVKYEDIKKDPKKEFTSILKFFDYDVDEEKVKKAIKLTELDSLKKQEEENGFIENYRKANLFFGGKRRELELKHINKLIDVCGEQMEKLGYATSN